MSNEQRKHPDVKFAPIDQHWVQNIPLKNEIAVRRPTVLVAVFQLNSDVFLNLVNIFENSDSVSSVACLAGLINPKFTRFVVLFEMQKRFVDRESLVKFDHVGLRDVLF